MVERKSYLLRLPNELLEELNRWAKDDLRSLNAQIEFVLREAVRHRRRKEVDLEESANVEGKAAGT